MSRTCLSRSLFIYGRMSKCLQFILSLCFLYCVVYYFHFRVSELECDISTFSYASLPRIQMLKMYYRGDILVESPTKPCHTLCKLRFSLQLIVFNTFIYAVFNDFLSLTFCKTIFSRTWKEVTPYREFVCGSCLKGYDCDKWYQSQIE